MPGSAASSSGSPVSEISAVFRWGTRRTTCAPGKRCNAAARAACELKPTTARVCAVEALGEALRGPISADEVRGHGSAVAAADEALAHVTLEASGRPLVVSNADLSEARVGGLGTDLVASFLHELAEGGGLTLHVRLIDGDDPQYVLEAIFKALGIALAQAGRPRKRKE